MIKIGVRHKVIGNSGKRADGSTGQRFKSSRAVIRSKFKVRAKGLARVQTFPFSALLSWLFSCNLLNVAISRALCLAYLVCSPRLLEARCESIEGMEMVNALFRLAEYAERKPT